MAVAAAAAATFRVCDYFIVCVEVSISVHL